MSQSPLRNPFMPDQTVPGPMQQEAIINRLIGRTFTHTVVRVTAVYPGTTGPVGFVDVIDLVQQLDGNDEGVPNSEMHRLPYFRLQGGHNAIVLDPKVGDLGLASFAMRDITKIKNGEREESAPPSRRQYSQSDGLYIGGFLNGAPTQFIEFLESGINITSTGTVTVNGTLLQVNCPIISTGDITDHTGSMKTMRDQYNEHAGHYSPANTTPDVPMS